MESFWARFRLDPRLPRNTPLRASDADREVVRDVLGDAFADGRLTREEYDERVTTLFETRTLGELPALVDDLVDPEEPPAEPARGVSTASAPRPGSAGDPRTRAEASYRKELSGAFGTFLIVGLITWALWLAAGAHNFAWPILPTAVFGVRLVRMVTQRDALIDHEQRRLRARQDRADQAARVEEHRDPGQVGPTPPATPPQPPVRLDKPEDRERPPRERPGDGE